MDQMSELAQFLKHRYAQVKKWLIRYRILSRLGNRHTPS